MHSFRLPELRLLFGVATFLLPPVAATLVYFQFLDQWFVTDDFLFLQAASGRNIFEFVGRSFTSPIGPNVRPLFELYMFGMYRMFALEGVVYHVANLLLHGAISVLVVLLVLQVSGSRVSGLVAGLVFAVTPAYGVSVTWVTNATSLIAGLCFISAVTLFLRFWGGERRPAYMALSLLMFVAGLLARETVATLPAVLIVLGLAVKPVSSKEELAGFGRVLLPFVIIDAVYVAGQIAQTQFALGVREGVAAYGFDWNVAPALIDRLLWLSLPLPSSSGAWVDTFQWFAFAGISLAVGLHVVWRRWVVPAFFACTIIALLPEGLLPAFTLRYVYVASIFWAGLLACLLAFLVEWWFSTRRFVGEFALAMTLVLLAIIFVPETIDSQRRMPRQAEQMQAIRKQVEAHCPGLGPGRTVFIAGLSISVVVATPTLIDLLAPGTNVVLSSPDDATEGDCLLTQDARGISATRLDSDGTNQR